MKFIIVDDSEYSRKQLSLQVNAINSYEVIATAQNGQELLNLVSVLNPAVILADVHLPDMNIFKLSETIISIDPTIFIICITQSNISQWIYQMKEVGIKGYLYKTCKPANIQRAISSVILNEFYVDEAIVANLVKEVKRYVPKSELSELKLLDNRYKPLTDKVHQYDKGGVNFTERELFILSATRNGIKVEEIARQLCISTRSISFIKEGLREKLLVKSNPELVPEAIKHHIID